MFPIHIPSLSERKPDIAILCNHFLKKYREQTEKNILSISPDAMRIILSYCWPGNVRELENAIEHAFVLCRTNEIQVVDLPHDLKVTAVREGICAEKSAGLTAQSINKSIITHKIGGRLNITREELIASLEKHGGNKAATARTLGISKVGLWKKMKKMDIS